MHSWGNMANKVKGIPDGASVIIPRLVCRDPAAMIEFCASTFGAVERLRRPGPDGTVAHALMMIGPAMVMIESEWPTLTSRAPKPDGSSPVVVFVYVEDVDQTLERAIAAGAKVLIPIQGSSGETVSIGSWIHQDMCGRSRHASKRQLNKRESIGGPTFRRSTEHYKQ